MLGLIISTIIYLEGDIFCQKLASILHQVKIVSGDVISFKKNNIRIFNIEEYEDFKKLLRYLMPGFCLVSRQDLMRQEMQKGKDAIDAMLEYLKTTTHIVINEKGEQSETSDRKEKGWIVPIALGFQGISDLSKVDNSRDNQTQHKLWVVVLRYSSMASIASLPFCISCRIKSCLETRQNPGIK
jgi:CRISPR-associated protein Csy2